MTVLFVKFYFKYSYSFQGKKKFFSLLENILKLEKGKHGILMKMSINITYLTKMCLSYYKFIFK